MAAPGPAGDAARRPAFEDRPGIVERVTARVAAAVEPLVARILGVPRIAMARAVYARYAAAGGPVLARGLAFVALFALVPGLLAVLSVAAFLVGDPAIRGQLVQIVADQVPPLAPVIDEALRNVAGLAATGGIVSIVLLVWSASSVVRALDGAFRVVFEDSGKGRTPLRDVAAVAAVAGGAFAAAIALVLVTLPRGAGDAIGIPDGPAGSIVSFTVATGLVALAYRFVPRPRPAWRTLALPAFLVGIAVSALTALFGVIGPLLFGSAQLYGAFGALFLGLIWLGTATEILLVGAAWVAERAERERGRTLAEPPGEAPGI
ncbi:MAG: YihY/virulence factor BrkB family protein [Chloroflexi bacterium]|nr:YihY/virulence factor BrkB family protein [Chloroflexota bacterium]